MQNIDQIQQINLEQASNLLQQIHKQYPAIYRAFEFDKIQQAIGGISAVQLTVLDEIWTKLLAQQDSLTEQWGGFFINRYVSQNPLSVLQRHQDHINLQINNIRAKSAYETYQINAEFKLEQSEIVVQAWLERGTDEFHDPVVLGKANFTHLDGAIKFAIDTINQAKTKCDNDILKGRTL